MREMLITSSVLILALLLLRFLFRSTISRRVQYALWLLVALRLLVPVSVGTSGWSVAVVTNKLPEQEISESILTVVGGDAPDLAVHEPDPSLPEAEQRELYQAYQKEWKDEVDRSKIETGGIPITVQSILHIVRYIGMTAMALWFLAANLRFARSLRHTRVPLDGAESKYPVYLCDDIPSPCLFGLFRPAIYVTSAAAKDENRLRYVIAHEETHARHLDPLWSLVRSVCLAVWWFNPLVWLAAYCSKADCELACDEGVLARLGETERVPYGETLLALVPVRRGGDPMLAATTMTAGKRQMKDRIQRIAGHKRPLAVALVAVLALTGIVCTATFTGAASTPMTEEEALDALEASITLRNDDQGVSYVAFTLPEYGRSGVWDIHISGRAVYPDGMSKSVHEYELFPDVSHWEAGREYTIRTDNLTELTLQAALAGQDGKLYERGIDVFLPNFVIEEDTAANSGQAASREADLNGGSTAEHIVADSASPVRALLDSVCDADGAGEPITLRLSSVYGESVVESVDNDDARASGNFRFFMNYLFRSTDVSFEPAELPALDENTIELTIQSTGDRLRFWEGTNLLWIDRGGTQQCFRAVYAVGDTVAGDLMRDWYDEAEFCALGGDDRKQNEIVIPDRGQTWLEAAQEFCERFEGIHLQASVGSKYKYTFVRPTVKSAEEQTAHFRSIGNIDENTWCFFLSTAFVPENERALNWSMAGNTGNYTGGDPDVPAGAYEYSRCGYAHRVPDGWRCEIVGTGW